jgi:signal transduction histidine kinase
LETVLSSIVDGVLVLDLKGNVVRSNPAAQKLMADITPEFKRNLLQELRLLAAAANALDEQMLVSNQPAQSTSTKRYRAGHRFFSAQAAPMQTPAGKILGSVIALRDTTREAEMENLQDGFVATISHELRTPWTAVKGYSDLLLKVAETGIDESHRPLMEKINTNANRLLTHVGKLIDITELQSDSLALNITELDWVELVTEVVEQWRERIEERQLTLTLSTECQSVILRGDAKRLRWAIDNLMSNAYNYTEQGEIDVELCCRPDEVQLNIHDTGVGIGSVDQPYLFTRFFRAQNNHEFTYNVDGVGLGLFITRSIIDRHSGRAWAKSQLNVGSTFSITLPLHSAQDDQLPADSN